MFSKREISLGEVHAARHAALPPLFIHFLSLLMTWRRSVTEKKKRSIRGSREMHLCTIVTAASRASAVCSQLTRRDYFPSRLEIAREHILTSSLVVILSVERPSLAKFANLDEAFL